MSKWRAEWSGGYPTLCHGEWTLLKDSQPIDNIPFQGQPAYTFGEFEQWSFDENWHEVFESYEDGMSEESWIEHHRSWLERIAEEQDFPKIYKAFAENDFRTSSCGGCI